MPVILKLSSPAGAVTMTVSPLRLPSRVRPSGDSLEMRPAALQLPLGLMRRQSRLEQIQFLTARLKRALGIADKILPEIVETLRPLPHDAARFAQGIAGSQPRKIPAMITHDLLRSAIETRLQLGNDLTPLAPIARQ